MARSTLALAIDVSGSFRGKKGYESAVDFAANYLCAYLHGLGGLKEPTAVFVGSFGGEKPGGTKSFQPIMAFEKMMVPQTLRLLYPRRTVAVHWEKSVPRRHVRIWTVDDDVMATWRSHYHEGKPPEQQAELWKWINDNVDFGVRSAGIL